MIRAGIAARADPLPRPGSLWGRAPQQVDDAAGPLPPRPRLRRLAATAAAAEAAARAWLAMTPAEAAGARAALRRRLRREGFAPDAAAQALGCAAAAAERTLGLAPYPTQLLAAAALLDRRMAEMATGEGKTLAAALAAAAAGLAGIPVHVITANEYLAARDAALLAPLYAALGLGCGWLDPTRGDDDRRALYRRDIVHATARTLAFDHLRDRLAAGRDHPYADAAAAVAGATARRPAPLMRGLAMAILDEADSILLDEADIPLVLSRSAPHAGRRAFLWQAVGIARRLQAGTDFELLPADRAARLTSAGRARAAEAGATLGGPWLRPRFRDEALTIALTALHGLRRGEHYLVRNGAIELLDGITGRVAPGRSWSRGLHGAVEIKEGLSPSPEPETLAQTTFQRFFLGYHRLCGMSGTLREARAELREIFGLDVVVVPLRRPASRRRLPTQVFADAPARRDAVARRAAEMQRAGRPVLVGTDSVAESQALSQRLAAAGIPHAVLNALNEADEAAIVAQAGSAGRVTVATRMAGRGTDIVLDAAARIAGGLHVICCQDNPSRRLDRQLAGRCARQGDPGSVEDLLTRYSAHARTAPADTVSGWPASLLQAFAERLPTVWRRRLRQALQERRRRALRRALLQQDRRWQQRLAFAAPE